MWIVSLSWSGTRAQLVKFAARIRAIRQSGIIILPTNAAEPLPATPLTRCRLASTANLNARFLFATSDIIGVKSRLLVRRGPRPPCPLRFEYNPPPPKYCVSLAFTLAYLFLSRPSYCSVPRNLAETKRLGRRYKLGRGKYRVFHLCRLIISRSFRFTPTHRATRGKVNLLCASTLRGYTII